MANIDGTNNNDNLVGTDEDDVIQGFSGNDSLEGLGGSDRLIGGSGNDTHTGGAGADVFVYDRFGGRDKITDFTQAEDVNVSSFKKICRPQWLLANNFHFCW